MNRCLHFIICTKQNESLLCLGLEISWAMVSSWTATDEELPITPLASKLGRPTAFWGNLAQMAALTLSSVPTLCEKLWSQKHEIQRHNLYKKWQNANNLTKENTRITALKPKPTTFNERRVCIDGTQKMEDDMKMTTHVNKWMHWWKPKDGKWHENHYSCQQMKWHNEGKSMKDNT